MSSVPAAWATPPADTDQHTLAQRLAGFDHGHLAERFRAQGQFLSLDAFLPPAVTDQLIAATAAARVDLNRNYLPGHKKGGSVSRHSIDRLAPAIAALYNSPILIHWLEQLAGEKLLPSPAADPHAYALYFYTEPGDHIGWHYDTSYYKGRRYTLLLGIADRSSCRLEYRLHTRDPAQRGSAANSASTAPLDGAIAMRPGDLVFFDGDRLQHRITPLGEHEERISLTFEYVTDTRMGRWQRFISNLKDAIAYFGFRQVFRQMWAAGPRRQGPRG